MSGAHPRFLFPNLLPELITRYTLLLVRIRIHSLRVSQRCGGSREVGLRPAPGTVSIFYTLNARGAEEISKRIEVGVL